jgi:chromosome segregation ATPase
MSFSSNLTSKSRALGQGPTGWDDDREQKIRSEYELRIAGLERKIGSLEGEKEELARKENEQRERGREWEDEVRGLKERAALHASNLRSLQHELDLARDAAEAARSHTDQSGRQAQEEINQWRDRCDNLEDEVRRLEVEKTALEAAVGAGGAGVSRVAVDIFPR